MNITIGIILFRNSDRAIEKCLTSLLSQSQLGLIGEVLVRDQGGGSCKKFVDAWIERHPGALPIVYSEGKNLGFSSGHNKLFQSSSTGSIAYLCLNPDGIMHPNCLSSMVYMAEQKGWRGLFEAIQEPLMHPKTYSPLTGETAWCTAACLLIPSAIFKELNGFDENFFMYCEDVDFSWRAKVSGYQCFVCPEAWFYHDSMDRTGVAVELWKSACILAHKWRSKNFKEYALNVLTTTLDIHSDELLHELKNYKQQPLEAVYRANPNFQNNLTFADPMWE